VRKLQLPADEVASFLYLDGPPLLRALAFGPDGRSLAVLLGTEHASCCLYEWDLLRLGNPTRLDPASSEHGVWLPDPVLSADHQVLAHQADEVFSATLLTDRSAQGRGERLLIEPEEEGTRMYRALSALAFDRHARLLAGASFQQQMDRSTVYLWDVPAAFTRPAAEDPWADPISPLPGPALSMDGEALCLAFAPDGRWLVVGRPGGTVVRWELPAGRPLPLLRARGSGNSAVRRMAFSPESDTLAVAAGKTVTLFAVPTGAVRAVLTGHDHPVGDLAFHPGGRTLATACGRPATDWSDVYQEDEPGSLPDLDRFICGKGAVHLWDVGSGKERQRFDWDVGAPSAVAFAPDGCTCAVGGEIGQIVLWDVDDG
jgi:WD40 repeat protein